MASIAKVWLVGKDVLPREGGLPEIAGVDFARAENPQQLAENIASKESIVALVSPENLVPMQELFRQRKLVMLPALRNADEQRFRFQVQSLLQAARLEYELEISDAVAWRSFSENSTITIEFLAQAMLEVFSCHDLSSVENVLFNKCSLLAPIAGLKIYEDPPFVPFSEVQVYQLAVPVQVGGKLLAHIYTKFAHGAGLSVEQSCERVGEALISLCDAVGLTMARNRLMESTREGSLIWEASFDAVADPVVLLGGDQTILRANSAFAEFLRCEKRTLVGKPLAEVWPEIRGFLKAPHFEQEWTREDRHYRISFDPIEADQFFRKASGGEFVLRIHNVTAEIKLREQILAREQAADLGILIGSVAHEINNPVAGILMFAQLLLRQIKSSDPLHSEIAALESAAQRMKRIVETMLALVRRADDKSERISYKSCLEDVLELIAPEAKRLRIPIDYACEIPDSVPAQAAAVRAKVLQAFFQLLQQTLVNLEASFTETPAFRAELKLRLALGTDSSYAVLELNDNGRPIPQVDESSVAFNVVRILAEEQGGSLDYKRESRQNRQTLRLPLLKD